jgi:hypothetical protein
MKAEAQAARNLVPRYHISTCLCCWGEFIAGNRKQATEICMIYASPQVYASYWKVFRCSMVAALNRATCPNFAHVLYSQGVDNHVKKKKIASCKTNLTSILQNMTLFKSNLIFYKER